MLRSMDIMDILPKIFPFQYYLFVFVHFVIYVLTYYAKMYVNIFFPINLVQEPFVAHLLDNLYAELRNCMIKWENVNKFSIASTFDTLAIKMSNQAHGFQRR